MLRRLLCALGMHHPVLVESHEGTANYTDMQAGPSTYYLYACARRGCWWIGPKS